MTPRELRAYVAAQLYDDRIDLLKSAIRRQSVDLRRLELDLIRLEAEKHTAIKTQRPWAKRHAA